LREVALFLAIGGTATLLNMIFYVSLVNLAGVKPTAAAALSFVMVVPFHFISYARVVFPPDRVDLALLIRYVLALGLSFALNVGLVAVYWDWLGFQPLPAQILGLIPAILANYLTFKFFVFRSAPLRMPDVDPATAGLVAVIGISAATLYAAIAAMLMTAGPAPAPAVAAELRTAALGDILGTLPDHSQWLPQLIVGLNAILFGSAPSIMAILTTGLIGLAGLLLAAAIVEPMRAGNADLAAILAAGLTALACFMAMHLGWSHFEPTSLIAQALVVLGAVVAALSASGLTGRLTQPSNLAIFAGAALVATLSEAAGAMVWLLAIGGLALAAFRQQTPDAKVQNFIALICAFSAAASLLYGAAAYVPMMSAALLAALGPTLHTRSARTSTTSHLAAAALISVALLMAAKVYLAIAPG